MIHHRFTFKLFLLQRRGVWKERDRRTWLILPVVICLFQGLSHANVRVLVLRYRGVCVRLIITILIYPTKDSLLLFRRDNCAKCAANTWKKVSRLPNHIAGKLCIVGSRKLLAETKTIAVPTADPLIVDAGQRSRSVIPCGFHIARCWMNSRPIRQSVV